MTRRILGLIALVALVVPVAAVAVPGDDLHSRVTALEERVTALETGPGAQTVLTTLSPPSSSTTAAPTANGAPTTMEPPAITTTDAPTTTAASATTTAPAASESEVTGGAISGTVCPGMVHGVATLVGNVNLTCDIMVMGSTAVLRARPGVNVVGNGHQIMFMNGARADFQGTPTSTWSQDGKQQNWKRDINFSGLSRIMFHEGAGVSTLEYFAIKNSGHPELGFYPLHFHLNGNSTRGTQVIGVVIEDSVNRAFVPHASHGITFRDTMARNIAGSAFWWDSPSPSTDTTNNSNDILIEHALADGVTNSFDDDRGFRLSAFRLGAGVGNTIRNSVALDVSPSHSKDCAGFSWPELNHNQPTSWTFQSNASFGSDCNGIFVWQNNNDQHIIDGFRGDGIDHGAYNNRYNYRNVDVDFIEIHAGGWSVTGGKADVVTANEHSKISPQDPTVTMTNLDIGSFVVNNADDNGDRYGVYVLNNTGLACTDIVYKSVEPGTKVIIDGNTC